MPVKVMCRTCGKSYQLADGVKLNAVRCKNCDEVIRIRQPQPRQASEKDASSSVPVAADTAAPAADWRCIALILGAFVLYFIPPLICMQLFKTPFGTGSLISQLIVFITWFAADSVGLFDPRGLKRPAMSDPLVTSVWCSFIFCGLVQFCTTFSKPFSNVSVRIAAALVLFAIGIGRAIVFMITRRPYKITATVERTRIRTVREQMTSNDPIEWAWATVILLTMFMTYATTTGKWEAIWKGLESLPLVPPPG